jgi:hypothetical protein
MLKHLEMLQKILGFPQLGSNPSILGEVEAHFGRIQKCHPLGGTRHTRTAIFEIEIALSIVRLVRRLD